jgi:Concanavalin A-like lectin/glucanases superfamily
MLKALLLPALLAFAFTVRCQNQKPFTNMAVRLNGETDYIDFGDNYKDLKLPFTISAWANIDTTNLYYAPIFSNRNCVDVYTGFRLIVDRNLISLEYGDGFGRSNPAFRRGKAANVKLPPGTWHHIAAVVRDPNTIELYLDGINVGGEMSGTSHYPMDSDKEGFASAGYFISNNVEYRFKGMIDDIRFWSRALTRDEVRTNMCNPPKENEPALIGYWDFNEAAGVVVNDKSSKKLHGKFIGKPTRVVANLPCVRTSANDRQIPEKSGVTNSGDK